METELQLTNTDFSLLRTSCSGAQDQRRDQANYVVLVPELLLGEGVGKRGTSEPVDRRQPRSWTQPEHES